MRTILSRFRFRVINLLGLLGGTAWLAGCTTFSAPVIQEPFNPTTHRVVKIEPCENRTGFTGERNLKDEATRIFSEKIKAMNLFQVSADAPLLFTCDIESFKEGNALKRWVVPGWGATDATVAVVVRDIATRRILVVTRSQQEVGGGGLFSIGANEYILDRAFNDIIKQHEAWAKPGRKEAR